MYICPKCKLSLSFDTKSARCQNNHCFDISSKGYVNLLLGSKKSSAHGDSKEMLDARRDFLNLGYYSQITKTLCEIILISGKKNIAILDAGCGEGYYTFGLSDVLSRNGISTQIFAIDVSKDAVLLAAKLDKKTSYSVASVNSLPFKDEAFDFVLSLFAPLCEQEFHRVLKPGGALVTVSPSEEHLFTLKTLIYDTPYKNPPSTFIPKLLTKTDEFKREWRMTLDNNADISNLFKMTPYYHKTSKKDLEKLSAIHELSTEIGFVFGIYKKD